MNLRRAWLLLLLPGLPLNGFASDGMDLVGENSTRPPAYKTLRFDEDYSCLSKLDRDKTGDWFDRVKYIPLDSSDPTWYLTLGGELRERFEGAANPDFGINGSHDAYWLQRVTLLTDWHLGQQLRFFVEGISGLMGGESQPAPPVQQDPIDLQFAFAEFTPYLVGDEKLALRAGRFGMSLGSGRLVATRASPNIPFKFDGFELLYSRPAWQVTTFLSKPVAESKDDFDSYDDHTAFWGAYATHWFDKENKSGLDWYYLGIDREDGFYSSGHGAELRHSFGARLFGEQDHWDWNGEGVVQVGDFGDKSIFAWTASIDSGYTLDTTLQPRFGLKADITSGDTNPNDGHLGTFDALYFKSGYFNDASLLRPENIMDIHPNVAVQLTDKISLNGGADFFWRYSREDAVYAPGGYIQIPAISAASPYVGTALDLNFEWQLQKHVTLQASYVHMFTGSYVHDAGGGDVDYVSTTLSFVF